MTLLFFLLSNSFFSLRGNTLGVVVDNCHREERLALNDRDRVYFADKANAGGILEAIAYYDFFNL